MNRCNYLLEFSVNNLYGVYIVLYFNAYADYIAIMNAHLICILLVLSRLDLFFGNTVTILPGLVKG
jgi:hypothetical protein